MKGYCTCGALIDETEIRGMEFDLYLCEDCFGKSRIKVKFPKLKIINKKKKEEFYYKCNTVEWNYFLNRYYPKAELVLIRCQLSKNLTLIID